MENNEENRNNRDNYETCVFDVGTYCDRCNGCNRFRFCICCNEQFHYVNGTEFKENIPNGEQKIFICNNCIENI